MCGRARRWKRDAAAGHLQDVQRTPWRVAPPPRPLETELLTPRVPGTRRSRSGRPAQPDRGGDNTVVAVQLRRGPRTELQPNMAKHSAVCRETPNRWCHGWHGGPCHTLSGRWPESVGSRRGPCGDGLSCCTDANREDACETRDAQAPRQTSNNAVTAAGAGIAKAVWAALSPG